MPASLQQHQQLSALEEGQVFVEVHNKGHGGVAASHDVCAAAAACQAENEQLVQQLQVMQQQHSQQLQLMQQQHSQQLQLMQQQHSQQLQLMQQQLKHQLKQMAGLEVVTNLATTEQRQQQQAEVTANDDASIVEPPTPLRGSDCCKSGGSSSSILFVELEQKVQEVKISSSAQPADAAVQPAPMANANTKRSLLAPFFKNWSPSSSNKVSSKQARPAAATTAITAATAPYCEGIEETAACVPNLCGMFSFRKPSSSRSQRILVFSSEATKQHERQTGGSANEATAQAAAGSRAASSSSSSRQHSNHKGDWLSRDDNELANLTKEKMRDLLRRPKAIIPSSAAPSVSRSSTSASSLRHDPASSSSSSSTPTDVPAAAATTTCTSSSSSTPTDVPAAAATTTCTSSSSTTPTDVPAAATTTTCTSSSSTTPTDVPAAATTNSNSTTKGAPAAAATTTSSSNNASSLTSEPADVATTSSSSAVAAAAATTTGDWDSQVEGRSTAAAMATGSKTTAPPPPPPPLKDYAARQGDIARWAAAILAFKPATFGEVCEFVADMKANLKGLHDQRAALRYFGNWPESKFDGLKQAAAQCRHLKSLPDGAEGCVPPPGVTATGISGLMVLDDISHSYNQLVCKVQQSLKDRKGIKTRYRDAGVPWPGKALDHNVRVANLTFALDWAYMSLTDVDQEVQCLAQQQPLPRNLQQRQVLLLIDAVTFMSQTNRYVTRLDNQIQEQCGELAALLARVKEGSSPDSSSPDSSSPGAA